MKKYDCSDSSTSSETEQNVVNDPGLAYATTFPSNPSSASGTSGNEPSVVEKTTDDDDDFVLTPELKQYLDKEWEEYQNGIGDLYSHDQVMKEAKALLEEFEKVKMAYA